jgi:hypothetical protein
LLTSQVKLRNGNAIAPSGGGRGKSNQDCFLGSEQRLKAMGRFTEGILLQVFSSAK